jgi:hypothetical protein
MLSAQGYAGAGVMALTAAYQEWDQDRGCIRAQRCEGPGLCYHFLVFISGFAYFLRMTRAETHAITTFGQGGKVGSSDTAIMVI